jgi:phosphoglycolate phosphatase
MEALGAKPSSTLYVGDSNIDMETAHNSGIASCGVSWGFRGRQELEEAGAEHIVDTAEELLALILS